MDNILKLIVGCLGLVGLVVMIIPNSDPLAKKREQNGMANAPAGNAVAGPPPPPAAAAGTAEAPAQQDDGNVIVEDYDIASFGQPMVDPTPPGQRNQQQVQQQPMQQQQPYNAGAIQQPGNLAGSGPPPPPPGMGEGDQLANQ
jgi:hypothetical protein